MKFQNLEEAQLFADKKADELGVLMSTKIYPLIFVVDEENSDYAIGFLKTPMREVKLNAIDMHNQLGGSKAGQYLLSSCLIPGESDPRITSNSPEHDDIYLGAVFSVNKLVTAFTDVSKKK